MMQIGYRGIKPHSRIVCGSPRSLTQ